MDIGNVVTCLLAGALGGSLYHVFWLVKLGQTSSAIPSSSSRHRNFRMGLMVLSLTAGATAGLLVCLWHWNELRSGGGELNKVATISAIAGLSGESLLGLLRRIAGA